MLGAHTVFVFLDGGSSTAADCQRADEGRLTVRLSMHRNCADWHQRQERGGS